MSMRWILETHGDPLTSVRQLITTIWRQCQLDGLLTVTNSREKPQTKFIFATQPEQINSINPFQPLMTMNVACLIPQLVQTRPEAKIGIILRPCEMRAFQEMVKRANFPLNRLLTICLDCLGTIPANEYRWRATRNGVPSGLSSETLQFARQGGIVPHWNRAACQICLSPVATEADINAGVIGLPVRQYLSVNVRNPALARQLQLSGITDEKTITSLLNQRRQTITKLLERRARMREYLLRGLAETLPHNPAELVAMFESCATCQACLKVCPICTVEFPQRTEVGHYEIDDITRWLMACAGCGICEQACPNHLPLSLIFTNIKETLLAESDEAAAATTFMAPAEQAGYIGRKGRKNE